MLAGGDALKLDTIVTNKQQLAAWLESGCRPRAQWGMGTEHEKFGFCLDTLKTLPYDGERSIRAILEGLARQDRKSTRLNSSHAAPSYAVLCSQKINTTTV